MTKPGYKMTEIGELPEEWEVVEIGDNKVSELVMGQSPPSSSYNASGNGIPFLQGNADFGEIIPSPSIYCTKPLKLAEKGDILLSVRAPVGELNIAAFKCVIGRGLAAIRCNDKKTHYKYLYYYLKYSVNRLRSLSTGSTFKAVGKEILSHFEICLPDFEEQEKIAEILSTADETIQKVNEEITLTEKLKKGLMQTLLTKGIGHTKFKMTEIGEIPEEWGAKELKEIANIEYGKANPKSSGKIPIVGSSGIFGYTSKSLIETPTIVIGRKGTAGGLIYMDAPCWPSDTTFYLKYKIYVIQKYLFEYMSLHRLSGNKAKTTLPSIQRSELESYKLAIPPFPEQQKIAEILSTVDQKLELLRNKKTHLGELKKGMMEDLLTGRVRVKIATSKGEN